MSDAKYGMTVNLGKIPFDDAINKTTEALKTEGFGVLFEIDVKATLKKKIDVDFRNYKILGACNPPMAHSALSTDLMIGLLLPCNVIVFEEDSGDITVSIADPAEMFKIVDNPAVAGLAEKVRNLLTKVKDALERL
jgi:uncharacterized protein (DUF302 family)